jgi:hypothetical protein
VTPDPSAAPGSAAYEAGIAAANAISPVAAAFGITSFTPSSAALTGGDEVVQSGGLSYSIGGGFPKATASTPVLNTYAEVVERNLANNGSSSTSSSTPMVEMWDPWTHTQDGPMVPASGIMLTNPKTGQQVDSAAVFDAYQNYFGSNPEQMIFNLGEDWGKNAVNLYEQQNPTFNPTAGNIFAQPTVFQEIGPYNPFYDPNNGNQLAIFDSTGTEYLI